MFGAIQETCYINRNRWLEARSAESLPLAESYRLIIISDNKKAERITASIPGLLILFSQTVFTVRTGKNNNPEYFNMLCYLALSA
jgi:hypothetical protein